MSNLEMLNSDLNFLSDYGLNLEIYQNIKKGERFILVSNGIMTRFDTAKELKSFLDNLKDDIQSQEQEEAKKRRQFRSLLLEASETIAKRFGKQVYTLSIGDNNDNE